MDDAKKISLAFPCSEHLDKTRDGLFCKTCQHQVRDFRSSTIGEIKRLAETSTSNVCGIFRKSQIETSSPLLRYAAASIMAGTAAIVPSFAQEKKTEECTDLKKIERSSWDLTSEDEIEDDVLQGIVIEIIAEPEGGLENFYGRLKEALDKNRFMASKGKVYVALDIDSTGMITKYQVVRGIDSDKYNGDKHREEPQL
jgi:hypothetical protein